MLKIPVAAEPGLPVRTERDREVLVTVLHFSKQNFV